MKRRLTIGVIAAVAASVWAAPAANAQTAVCFGGRLPAQTIVDAGGGQINVYPANVVPYAGVVADYAVDAALCMVNTTTGPYVSCAQAFVANRPTVTVDPNTLQITIDYSEFMGTACAI